MKNSAYWKLRFEQLEAASHKNAISTFETIQEQYIAAEKEIERQISTWYQRFAKNNQITMAEARKLLTSGELAEFKWDVKEFIKYGEQNALNPQWMQELENASARFHISRLEALRIETQQTVEKLFGGQVDEVDKLLKKNYLQNYYHTVYEVQKGFNIGWDIAEVDDRTVEKLISKPWATDAKNFSERIWSNKASLINEVQTQLTRTIMLGKSPDDAIKAIAAKMKTSQGQAGRLVMTESAYFSSQSQKDAFNALDVERFEIVATLDSHTSEICRELDGHVEEMKNYEPGVTAPPFHPWCRTTTVPYFDDNFTERAARGADGKTYYVDSKLNYKDWKKTFVDGGSKDGLKTTDESDILKNQTFTEKINTVKDRVAANGGKITETDIHEAGEALRLEIENGRVLSKKAWEDAKKAYSESDIKKKIDELEKKKDELYAKYNAAPWGSERNQLYKEWDNAKAEYWKVYSNDEAAAYRTRIRDAQKAYTGNWEANAAELKSKLETFRTCGVGGKDLNAVHYTNRGTLRSVVTKAYDHYPSTWVDASVSKGGLDITKVNRGFYDGRTIAISSNSLERQMETAFHELGHRFEDVVSGIYEAEDVFYKRRTSGEKLEWLGSGYRKDERTRKDKFIHPYMGKEYPDNFYELCSMGFSYAYTNPTELLKDQDFAQFIYGILSLY